MNVIYLKFPRTEGGRSMIRQALRNGEFHQIFDLAREPLELDWDSLGAAVEKVAEVMARTNG